MGEPIKLNAVKRVFPNLNRGNLTNEEASQKVEAETGVKVAPGYLKHIFSGRSNQKMKRNSAAPQPAADEVRLPVLEQKNLGPASAIRETLALSKKLGGLAQLQELVSLLMEV